jgi:hypothetical protein
MPFAIKSTKMLTKSQSTSKKMTVDSLLEKYGDDLDIEDTKKMSISQEDIPVPSKKMPGSKSGMSVKVSNNALADFY